MQSFGSQIYLPKAKGVDGTYHVISILAVAPWALAIWKVGDQQNPGIHSAEERFAHIYIYISAVQRNNARLDQPGIRKELEGIHYMQDCRICSDRSSLRARTEQGYRTRVPAEPLI